MKPLKLKEESCRRQKNPHDKHFTRAWGNVRRGYKMCLADRDAFVAVMDCLTSNPERPGAVFWRKLLEGREPDRVRQMLEIDDFFDLSFEDQDFWQPVQSHPFAVILADMLVAERKNPAK